MGGGIHAVTDVAMLYAGRKEPADDVIRDHLAMGAAHAREADMAMPRHSGCASRRNEGLFQSLACCSLTETDTCWTIQPEKSTKTD